MRLMGATEGAIRAPFWLYATAEGLLGGGVALGLLYATYRLATCWLARDPHPGALGLLGRVPLAARRPAAAGGRRRRGARGKPPLARKEAHAPRHAHRLNLSPTVTRPGS